MALPYAEIGELLGQHFTTEDLTDLANTLDEAAGFLGCLHASNTSQTANRLNWLSAEIRAGELRGRDDHELMEGLDRG